MKKLLMILSLVILVSCDAKDVAVKDADINNGGEETQTVDTRIIDQDAFELSKGVVVSFDNCELDEECEYIVYEVATPLNLDPTDDVLCLATGKVKSNGEIEITSMNTGYATPKCNPVVGTYRYEVVACKGIPQDFFKCGEYSYVPYDLTMTKI